MDATAQVPVPDFSATTVAGCGPLSVTFKDLSTGYPFSWTWDFGNGQTSGQKNPSTGYNSPGVYTVTLIVKNSSGANSIRKTNYITVYPFPAVNFNSKLTLACAPANIQFTDLSTPGQGSITSETWDFGDRSTGSGATPLHTYSATGYYTVSLKVTNTQGCSNTSARTRYIRVIDGVQANFAWTQVSNSCSAPFLLNFINQTAGPGNLTYNWNLGAGANPANSTDTSPAPVRYPSNTSYTVSLTAQSDLGCSQTIQKTLTFPAADPAITAPDTACINTPVNLLNASAPLPSSFTWDFGDGTVSKTANPSKAYSTAGPYNVKVVNTYASCKDSASKTVQVINNPAPAFSASPAISCKAPLNVQFMDQTTPAPAKWLWNFGDGNTSTTQNPSHTYTTTGLFDVTLTVTNSAGCSSTITQTRFVQIVAPTVSINGTSLQGCINASIAPGFSFNVIDGIASYAWTAAGATPSSSNQPSPGFTYPTAGNYSISLTITTNGGCTATASANNAVLIGNPVTPVLQIGHAPPCGRDSVTFTSTATPADHWLWNFGDGSSSTLQGPVRHSYDNTGDFIVSLTLTNSGCPQTKTAAVHVNPPIPAFTFQPDCTDKFTVKFTNSSSVDPALAPIIYLWDFGDPSNPVLNTSNLASPVHVYPNTGAIPVTYNVTLTVTNGICTNTITLPVNLSPTIAAFTPPNPIVCKNTNFTLTSTSSNPSLIKTYAWQIGTGAVTISPSPAYTASLPATSSDPVVLTITDIYGCTSTVTGNITVTGPTAHFTLPATGGNCKNSPVSFTDNSTAYPGPPAAPIIAWHWDFGNGAVIDAGPVISHVYADTGSHSVTLTVTDNSGCPDTYVSPTPVQITAPQAFFTGPDSFYCPKVPLTFQDSSQGYGLTDSWNFGDGSPASSSPIHSFPVSGQTYPVTLTITDQVGCSANQTKNIRIQSPIAAFSIADTTTICPPLQTMFTPDGQYYDSLYWDFGDGATSTLPLTSHFYNTYDTFYAKLFLRGPGGCLDSATRRVFVLNPNTTTSLTYSPLQACDSVLTHFTVVPSPYTKFTLNFGDGQEDSSENTSPSHLYVFPSTYRPQLIIQDSTGCIVGVGGSSGNVTVLGAVPFFSMDQHNFCDSGTVNFTDFSIPASAISNWNWDFGDGSTLATPPLSNENPTHFYSTPGIRIATLKIVSDNICNESYSDTVHIYQTPHPVITVQAPFCINVPIQFQGSLVTPDPADTVNWSWNFGDGQTSGEQDQVIAYAQAGTYTVSLRSFVPFGCSDMTSQPVTVNPRPSIKGPAEITTPVGFPVTLPFTYSANATNYSWTPVSNLSCTECPNPVSIPTFNTLYTVTVTDANNCGATDSILVKTICEGKNYFVPNTFSPNGDGVNDVFYPRGDNLYNIQSMRVFNRWGQLVFERRNFPANSAADGWDGLFNGRPAPPDAYIYIIEVVCNNAQIVALRGDVTLIR